MIFSQSNNRRSTVRMRPIISSSSSSIKKAFMKKWVLGLKICYSQKKKNKMGLLERKKAIKLSADIAMAASTRNTKTLWSRALISNALMMKSSSSSDDDNIIDSKVLVEHIVGTDRTTTHQYEYSDDQTMMSTGLIKKKKSSGASSSSSSSINSIKYYCNKRVRSNKVLKKSCLHYLSAKKKKKKKKGKGGKSKIEGPPNYKMVNVASSVLAKILVKKRTQVLKSLVPGGEFMDDFSLIEETLDYIVSLRAQVDVMRRLAAMATVDRSLSQIEEHILYMK